MALLRLSVVATLAACGQAGAQGSGASSGITAPAGWQAMPDIARAAGEATKADGVIVAGTEAWGDPARGCYAVWLRLEGTGASAEKVLTGITSERLETRDVVKPASEDGLGIIALAFSKPPYEGRFRARVEATSVTALACFANERERTACDAACTTMLGSLQ